MKVTERIRIFFKEVWVESRKVDWPNRQKTIHYTAIVIGISLAVAIFLGALDFLFLQVLSKFVL